MQTEALEMANTITSVQTHQTSNGTAPVEITRPSSSTSGAHTQPTQVATQKPDQASVSSVGALVAKASAGSDVRTEKVSALQSAISSGTYHVPASAVAGKIVDSLLS
jgi:negative regulator of flagellin synthesis FlgM